MFDEIEELAEDTAEVRRAVTVARSPNYKGLRDRRCLPNDGPRVNARWSGHVQAMPNLVTNSRQARHSGRPVVKKTPCRFPE